VPGVTSPIKVLIADDHSLVRAGFRSVLEVEDDIDIVGEAGDGAQAVASAVGNHPDVVLMDIRMPVVDGLEATRRIAEHPQLRETRVIVLTTFDLDDYVFGALRAGASSFLLKGVEPATLVMAVRTVAAGDSLLDPVTTRHLIEAFVKADRAEQTSRLVLPESVTPRELEILRLIAAGLTNQEIADHLYISPFTCKSHVSRILTKLGARDRTQLVVMAYESGLVTPGRADLPIGLLPQH
jgi:DNA-binding NarL/FixJ family response regulator